MNYFKKDNIVYAFDDEQLSLGYGKDMTPMTDEEVEAHINPPKTEAQIQAEFRFERNVLIDQADKLINKALDKNEDASLLREYREALRNATMNWVMPKLEDYLTKGAS